MKFISWNVNGLRAIVKKNFLEAFETFDADFFLFARNEAASRGRSSWICQDTRNTGIMQKRKDTLVQRSLLRNRHFLPIMGLASRNMMPKAGDHTGIPRILFSHLLYTKRPK